ncbi:MAG: S-layer homology domain-containing protein [Clostridiaceae bacterium]|nr:S-layer homology domain-containing protein [Clostridiaceae bacterium]
MRNLSKVLALVLSLAFVLTMFAGAITTVPDTMNYSDSADLSVAGNEAVMVLSALGIVNGYTDGSFQPASLVTRAEFAKMMSVALAAADVTTFYNVSTLPFKDTFDSWCIPYVNYCYLNEIMVGYGDGFMLPKNNVTGWEAIKMVLVGLGYDPKVEGLEGSAWINNTAKLSNKIGLLKNLETENCYAAFDREATAILVRNAIYTETVEYVGASAVNSGKTLGEKVYDLLDIRGIVVGNEYGYLGANWANAMFSDGTGVATTLFMDYQAQVVKGQTIFAYRDFTGASTAGGYYVPRIIHVALASDTADLGRAYRVLTTGAQNPTNTNEVRKLYGVIGEVATDADYVIKDMAKLSDGYLTGTKFISATGGSKVAAVASMLTSAQKANSAVTEDSIQSNIFIDGKAVSYKAAAAHIKAYKSSSAPYIAVDNDNDGIIDFLALYTYKAAKVTAVDAENSKLTIAGIGTKAIANSIEGIAVGDYVAFYADQQYNYVDKLVVETGKVTAYSKNSVANDDIIDGISTTVAGGSYTVNGKAYTFGSLAANLGADERQYFEDLLGNGASAVADATLQFVFDGSYIVAVFMTDETYWENYAVVIGYNKKDVTLGMRHVRLYTDDNEYKDFYIASYNGNQIYNSVVSGTWDYPEANTLVRYEEIGNNRIALYSYDFVNSSAKSTTDYDMYYDYTTKMWVGYNFATSGVQNGTLFNWSNGVVFVSYGDELNDTYVNDLESDIGVAYGRRALQWRAYWYGEFQPANWANGEAVVNAWDFPSNAFGNEFRDQVVYADSLNNAMTMKAAAITFDYEHEYTLPGLVLRDGQAIWGTIMGVTSIDTVIDPETSTAKYAYKVKILTPWSTATKDITIYSDVRLATFTVGDIYKLFCDEDGICRRFEIAEVGYIDGTEVGSNYLELGKYVVTGIIPQADGSYLLQLKQPYTTNGEVFYVDYGTCTLAADADAYFTKGLFTSDIEALDYITAFGYLGQLSMNNHESYTVYADLDPSSKTINSIWFNEEKEPSVQVVDLDVTLTSYDVNTHDAVYTLGYGIYFSNGASSLTVKQMPNELLMPVGATVECDVTTTLAENGGWYVFATDAATLAAAVKSPFSWAHYDGSNAMAAEYAFQNNKNEIAVYTTASTKTIYAPAADIQGFWVREGSFEVRIDPIYGADYIMAPNFYKNFGEVKGLFEAANAGAVDYLSYNPDNSASTVPDYDYEEFSVMYNGTTAVMVVYTDINGHIHSDLGSGITQYPYNAVLPQ